MTALLKAEVYWIDGFQPGRAGIVSRPRGGDWLDDEVGSWRRAGVDVVVSLLTPEEVVELSLEREEASCRAQGIRFLSLPIPDRDVPASRQAATSLIETLVAEIKAGRSVAIHCRQGIGRSALLAASLLACFGVTADDAFRAIEESRGCPVPDTSEQRGWVEMFVKNGE